MLERFNLVNKYTGEWVVIVHENVISHGNNLGEMIKRLKKDFPVKNPF